MYPEIRPGQTRAILVFDMCSSAGLSIFARARACSTQPHRPPRRQAEPIARSRGCATRRGRPHSGGNLAPDIRYPQTINLTYAKEATALAFSIEPTRRPSAAPRSAERPRRLAPSASPSHNLGEGNRRSISSERSQRSQRLLNRRVSLIEATRASSFDSHELRQGRDFGDSTSPHCS